MSLYNVEYSVEDGTLQIDVDLDKAGDFGKSKSGKSIKVGSTVGYKDVPSHPGFRFKVIVLKKVKKSRHASAHASGDCCHEEE